MTDTFQNNYRIASARLQNWDYSWSAPYFITICTKDRTCYFGDITNGKMELSRVGVVADIMWHEIKNHAKHVELGPFVVMPNHIHGIISINNPDEMVDDVDVDDVDVETRHALSLPQPQPPGIPEQGHKPPPQTIGQQRFQNQGKNTLSSIIGSYKSAVTKHANRLGLEFGWQARFHDHIIRDEKEYQRIANYIQSNPENWVADKFFSTSQKQTH